MSNYEKTHYDNSNTQDLFIKEKGSNNIALPWKHGKWLIWPETTLSDIQISDCNDTVEGICYRDTTLEQCLERCPADNCGAGVYVKFKNGKSICNPIVTGFHPKLTPLYRIKNQSLYNLDPNLVEMSVFVNTNLFPFPPNYANTVFYGDLLAMEDAKDGRTLDTSTIIEDGPGPCILKKGATSVINLQPLFRTVNPLVHDRPLAYGDKLILTIAGTSFTMQMNQGGINPLVWKESLEIGGDNLTFILVPDDPTKKKGDLVTYSDTVSLLYPGNGMVAVNRGNNQLYVNSSPLLRNQTEYNKSKREGRKNNLPISFSHSGKSPFNVYFKFKSLSTSYYCDEGICKPVKSKDIIPAHSPAKVVGAPSTNVLVSGTYKGKAVYAHKGCWGICNNIKFGKGNKNTIRISDNQHLPELATHSPLSSWERNKKKPRTILFVIGIVLITILILILGIMIYKHTRKFD